MVTEQATAHPPEDELLRYACDLKIGHLVQAGSSWSWSINKSVLDNCLKDLMLENQTVC